MTRVDLRLKSMFLSEILWVCDSGWAQVDVLTWRGDGSIIGVDPGEYYSWGFCNLVVNSGCAVGH